jgi:hypothetical protein
VRTGRPRSQRKSNFEKAQDLVHDLKPVVGMTFLSEVKEDRTKPYSHLPLPVGEGWGEGLTPRRPQLIFLIFECHSPTTEHKMRKQIPLASPHPRPFSQREKGEKLIVPTQTVQSPRN